MKVWRPSKVSPVTNIPIRISFLLFGARWCGVVLNISSSLDMSPRERREAWTVDEYGVVETEHVGCIFSKNEGF